MFLNNEIGDEGTSMLYLFYDRSLPFKKRITEATKAMLHSYHEFHGFTLKEFEACEGLLSMKNSPACPANFNQDLNENVNDDGETQFVDLPPLDSLRDCIDECSKSFEKPLTGTDLKPTQCRLILRKKDVAESFLPMLKKGENIYAGIPVTVYDMFGNKFSMMFKMWSGRYYVLNGSGWNVFHKTHGLRKEIDWITVWMFRHLVTGNLCFAIDFTKAGDGEGDFSGSSSSSSSSSSD